MNILYLFHMTMTDKRFPSSIGQGISTVPKRIREMYIIYPVGLRGLGSEVMLPTCLHLEEKVAVQARCPQGRIHSTVQTPLSRPMYSIEPYPCSDYEVIQHIHKMRWPYLKNFLLVQKFRETRGAYVGSCA